MIDRKTLMRLSKEEKILVSNMIDKYEIYLSTGKSIASNFLNEYELNLVSSYLKKYQIPFLVYEPYEFLEKKIIYFGSYEDFITFYQISTPSGITHPKLLGTLFSIGFTEHTIGDIFIENQIAYYVNLTKMNSFLEENLRFVGGELAILNKLDELVLTENHLELLTIIVSSMRLDNVVSKIISQSRSQTIKKLMAKEILLNYQEIGFNSSILLKENDILSIRHVGKFKIGKVVKATKKDNQILEIYKYR